MNNHIYIITECLPHAKAFIEHFKLKKLLNMQAFQIFAKKDDNVVLCVAGESGGPTAIGYLAGRYNIARKGAIENNYAKTGKLLYLSMTKHAKNQQAENEIIYPYAIHDNETNKTFYQDMLYTHPFGESAVENTGAARVYEAASRFFLVHNIIILTLHGEETDFSIILDWLRDIMAEEDNKQTYREVEMAPS